jgi:hypothetical protein
LSGRRTLRRLLRLAVRADLALLLRDDQRRGLSMGRGACKLRDGESSRRKQHKTKFGHEGSRFRGITFVKWSKGADQQISVRPECGGVQTPIWIYFLRERTDIPLFMAYSGIPFKPSFYLFASCFRLSHAS